MSIRRAVWRNDTTGAYDDGVTDISSEIGGGGAPTGSAGGVLDGSYPNPGLAAGVAGAGLSESSDVLAVNVDGSTIEINADALRVKADGITANEIAAGAVGASELASTAVTPTTYGDATHVGQFTVDADGRITAASAVAITGTGSGAGLLELVYRYTVTGTDKASIDTGVDTPDAGSNDWSNGDLLEIFFYLRTDETTANSVFDVTLNNDTGNNYIRQTVTGNNTSASAGYAAARANWQLVTTGASSVANYFGNHSLIIPNYAGTVGYKMVEASTNRPTTTGAASEVDRHAMVYAATAAITRLKIIPDTSAKKFIVGSQILIYKRKAS